MPKYYETANELLQQFADVIIMYVPRKDNKEANDAQHASGHKEIEIKLETYEYPLSECLAIGGNPIDTWKEELEKYLKDPSIDVDFKV